MLANSGAHKFFNICESKPDLVPFSNARSQVDLIKSTEYHMLTACNVMVGSSSVAGGRAKRADSKSSGSVSRNGAAEPRNKN